MANGTTGSVSGSGLSVEFDSFDPSRWQRLEGARIATPTSTLNSDMEIDVCAPCHSRRSEIVAAPEIGGDYLDAYRPALPSTELYFEDGQIREEVYAYGSFLQSRMYAAGVRCSDCHDPHSLELRSPGNSLCLGCHAPEIFDAQSHHGHDTTATGGECVNCHMPERTYMEIDPRRDHAFIIPRPEREEILGTPSVCKDCHPHRDASWASLEIEKWRGEEHRSPSWPDRLVENGERLRGGQPWFAIAMDSAQTELVRAAAWSRYAGRAESPPSFEILKRSIEAGSSLERIALIEVAKRMPAEARFALLAPLLEDDHRAVRIAAAEAISDLPPTLGRPADRSRLARVLREYRDAQMANADRPEAQVNLGVMATRVGDLDSARAAYERALSLAAYFVPAIVNLADLERALGRDAEAVVRLREALALVPEDAMVRHALGLALYRAGEMDEALANLESAAVAAPEDERLVLAWALALDAVDRRVEAIAILSDRVEGRIAGAELFYALATLERDAGHLDRAREVAEEWRLRHPEDGRAAGLLGQLESIRGTSGSR